MRLLALDAATEACSAALLWDGSLFERSAEPGKSTAARLLGMIDELLAAAAPDGDAAATLAALDGLAASTGPGAFTGVRISVAVAQGLAFGARLRVVPVSTLEALAAQAFSQDSRPVVACLDARMGEVYFACFAADGEGGGAVALEPPQVGPPQRLLEAAQRLHVSRGIGRGFSAHALPGIEVDAQSRTALPRSRDIAVLGARRLAAGAGLDPADLQPLYLRDRVALTEAERALK